MRLLNATRMPASYTMGMKPSGAELLVVVVKGTFDFPHAGAIPKLSAEQAPLVDADTFTGEPGFSATHHECDYAANKPHCDVLLTGSAYAPHGEPAKRVRVSLEAGSVAKSFEVVGDRVWVPSLMGVVGSSPRPFTTMPITYDRAFGGRDATHPDESRHRSYLPNHIGRGFALTTSFRVLEGLPLPNTEESGRPVLEPGGTYQPMSFGPLSRSVPARLKFAGTYDQNWIDNIFPFLPPDFDERYYQAAPADQQMPYPCGGEEVTLINLTPEGRTSFHLPGLAMPIVFYPRHGDNVELNAVVDTLVLEPDLRRFTLTWRASLPLRKNMFEITEVLVGRMPTGWYRARELGKTYYPSLSALSASKAAEART